MIILMLALRNVQRGLGIIIASLSQILKTDFLIQLQPIFSQQTHRFQIIGTKNK